MTTTTENLTLHRFESVREFADESEALKPSPAWVKGEWVLESNLESPHHSEFTGADTYAHAVDIARAGWPEGLAAMQAARATMPRANATGAARDYDVAGMYPDAARAAAADPCAMVTPTAGALRGKSVVCLVSLGCVGFRTTAAAVTNQAAAICSLVDALEASESARCEIFRHYGTTDGTNEQHAIIKTKSAEDALDLARIAAALAPSTQRRLWFRFTEANPAPYWAKRTHGNYGSVAKTAAIMDELPAGALILPRPDNTLDMTPESSWAALTHWAANNGLAIHSA